MTEKFTKAEYLQRCLDLAILGNGYTAPNPLVGAVLVHGDRIIGEGYHQKWGGPHAEVNCLQSVKDENKSLISSSTLYVSLEPCCHHGKTPPCTDLILQHKIPHVVVGSRDPFPQVNGKGIEKLISNGVQVEFPVMNREARESNRRFFTFHEQHRPYIILKWAQSANKKIAGQSGERIKISNEYSDRLVHKWRTEEAGILIGTRTALLDNPQLTSRLWPGKNPIRLVLDKKLQLPDSLHIFDGDPATVILNETTDLKAGPRLFKKVDPPFSIQAIAKALFSMNILSVLVEGGPTLLNAFLETDLWDEIRIITNQTLIIPDGKSAPEFGHVAQTEELNFGNDRIDVYRKMLK